ncbi:hypothetical protein BX600DRAFT_482625 [Xylariales sp. PMI_506]|nr:hypothetical protein BX600DRAFT_482625 [Xylariales sp. PMI_506]
MASRLSENPAVQVAVVEAGTLYEVAQPLLASTPGGDVIWVGSSPSDSNPLTDWQFVTTPQAGAGNRKIHYCRGKCLGGSSAKNFMIYQRGTVDSYQQWADAVGDQSYTYSNLNKYFQKGVQFTPPNTNKRAANATAKYDPSAFISSGGPLSVSYPNYAQTFSTYLPGALTEIGISEAQDFNSGKLMGHQFCATTINPSNANRASSQTTYLKAASGRSNLKVFTLTKAQKILFSGKTATGVRVSTAGLPAFTLKARKEVILSAGAFQSPQLLMLSGIGPRATLERFGIPVLVDNPNVGQNMWDHVFAGPSYRVNVETFTRLANNPLYILAQFASSYTFKQGGPLSNQIADYLGWEKVPDDMRANFTDDVRAALAQFPEDWPEIEYIAGAGYVGDFSNLLTTQPKDGYQYATLLSALVAPLSRGNVTLASASADDLPIINPNWLTHPADQAVAVAAYKRARAAFASSAMQKIVIGAEYFPGTSSVSTDAEILDTYRKTLHTVWHAACTCKMGKATGDPTAVVDPHAKVIGVSGLRVVDASAFALLPPGHPQSTVYALAEKISDDIKNGL